MDLYLPLMTEYFEQIRSGTKLEEYRLKNPFWTKRLEGKQFNRIVLTKGYPKKGDRSRTIVRKWNGYKLKKIQSEFFGNKPVEVYAIDVSVKIRG